MPIGPGAKATANMRAGARCDERWPGVAFVASAAVLGVGGRDWSCGVSMDDPCVFGVAGNDAAPFGRSFFEPRGLVMG